MALTDGVGDQSSGDPALEEALAEMTAEGTFDSEATFADPGTATTSSTESASAAPQAAAPPPASDDGSSKVPTTTDVVAPASTSAAPAAADPFAGTEPLPFFVNGEAKSLSWAHRVPGEGVLLTEAEVPHLQQLAERAEILDRVARDLTSQQDLIEPLTRWTRTGPDGKEETLTGSQGLEEIRVYTRQLEAELATYRQIFAEPGKHLVGPTGLLLMQEGKPTLDPSIAELWDGRIEQARFNAERTTRAEIGQRGTRPAAVAAPASTGSGSPPSFTDKEVSNVITQAAGTNHTALLPEDIAELKADLQRYIRPVVASDRQFNPALKLGAPIVDFSFGQRVQRLASIRLAAKQTATAAETAGKHNAGMAKGRQPAKQPIQPPAPPAKAGDAPRRKADWDTPFKDAMDEMGIAIR